MPARVTEADMRRILDQPVAGKRYGSKYPSKKRLVAKAARRDSVYTNQLEERYAGVLEQRHVIGEIHKIWYQPFGIKLADKCYYHPDFMIQLADGTLEIHETKGFMRDDASVKIKTAARLFPCYIFRLVKWEKKQWVITEIPI